MALEGGRGDQGSRERERGRRVCRDFRNRKHLFALGVCEKKEPNSQQHPLPVPPPSLPPCRGLPFPAQPVVSPWLPSLAVGPPPGQGGSRETSSPSTCSPSCTSTHPCQVLEHKSSQGIGSYLATQIPGARMSQEHTWTGWPERE